MDFLVAGSSRMDVAGCHAIIMLCTRVWFGSPLEFRVHAHHLRYFRVT